ncbi:acyltransferase domain-containing protein, partial [Streptomyces sp. CSDS2]|uniref:acyltransferase domain-containing protein n=1 Tax=Streptomyces sp. CSDS2 TaxID=3055051 RepID=UPI0025AF4638
FAVMVSLARLWGACGVVPAAVVGHSQGEIAAAVVAGALSLADGARVVALRSRLIGGVLSGRGGMMSVAVSAEGAAELVAGVGDRVGVAVVNGPASVVLAGEPEALARVAGVCAERGVRHRVLPVDYASHSGQVAAVEERLLADLASVVARSSVVPFYSTVSGGLVDTVGLDAGYWYRNLRQPVLFEDATRALAEAGHMVFVEVSSHPVLVSSIEDTLAERSPV